MNLDYINKKLDGFFIEQLESKCGDKWIIVSQIKVQNGNRFTNTMYRYKPQDFSIPILTSKIRENLTKNHIHDKDIRQQLLYQLRQFDRKRKLDKLFNE